MFFYAQPSSTRNFCYGGLGGSSSERRFSLLPGKANPAQFATRVSLSGGVSHIFGDRNMNTSISINAPINVPFRGNNLYLVEHQGNPYVPMKPVVEGMGLDWKTQHRKMTAKFNS